MRLSADAHYRVAGPGLYESPIFGLPPGRHQVSVQAEMRSRSVSAGVLELVIGGTLFALVGPILLLAGADEKDHHEKDGDGLLIAGASVTLAGAVVGTVGLVTLVVKSSQRESKVRLARNPVPALALPGGLALDASGLRF
jgi:hypothetical protein